jgi:hypothetical protein
MVIGSEPAAPVLLAGEPKVRPYLDEVDVQALTTLPISALQTVAVEVLEVDAPALLLREVGGEFMLGGGRPSANRANVLPDLGGQPVDVMGIPWIVFANAAASGTDLERRTQQNGATQQSTACRRSKHRNVL